MSLEEHLLPSVEQIHSPNFYERVDDPIGIMLHYDGSKGADKWAVGWFSDPTCRVSYDKLYLDNGFSVQIIDDIQHHASWHGGPCLVEPGLAVGKIGTTRYGKANQGYHGFSITTGPGVPATLEQTNALLYDCSQTFRFYGWSWREVPKRLVTHASRRIYTSRDTQNAKLWGKLGVKVDPVGPDPKHPVLHFDGFTLALQQLLQHPAPKPGFDIKDPLALWRHIL